MRDSLGSNRETNVRPTPAWLLSLAAILPMTSGPQEKLLKVGQEWQFQGRTGDPQPTLVIDRIEQIPNVGEVVHVSVRGVHIRNPHAPGGFSDQLPHMPLSRSAVEKSITKLLHDSVALPGYEEGYNQWMAAHGGVFTITVQEALDFVERSLR
jgi:hypothetical protein